MTLSTLHDFLRNDLLAARDPLIWIPPQLHTKAALNEQQRGAA
ncbi:hypothetical protein ACFWB1_20440 [Streptomyces goshikiensis]